MQRFIGLVLVACFALAFTSDVVFAQQRSRCGFERFRQAAESVHIPSESDQQQTLLQLQDTGQVVIIPVVVHVLYRTSEQNISDAQIQSQIAALNRDFRRRNNDTVNTPAEFKALGADVGIEFRLATKTPAGLPTSGINRRQITAREIGDSENYYITARGGADAWDRNSYMNIWICEINADGSTLGFATQPNGPASYDGLVIDSRYFGTAPFVQPPLNNGRTTTHEVGHWFNLEHIWGVNVGCTSDDFVADTPEQREEYFECPTHPQTSCGSNDMFMNYMDYVNDDCMNIFTKGQRQRMRFALFGFRTSLLTSKGYDSNVVSVSESMQAGTAKIYPQPAQSIVTVEAPFAPDVAQAELISLVGVVAPVTIQTNDSRYVHLSLPGGILSGTYMLRFRNSNGAVVFSSPIVISR